MTAIKSLTKISTKWTDVTPGRVGEYTDGVQNPTGDWAKNTGEAEKRYEAGVQASISRKDFGKGVARAGNDKWQKNTLEKGPARWQQGVSLSTDAYAKGFQPYHDTINRLTLPARGPKGDPSNIQRVAVVAAALHNTKIQRSK